MRLEKIDLNWCFDGMASRIGKGSYGIEVITDLCRSKNKETIMAEIESNGCNCHISFYMIQYNLQFQVHPHR